MSGVVTSDASKVIVNWSIDSFSGSVAIDIKEGIPEEIVMLFSSQIPVALVYACTD